MGIDNVHSIDLVGVRRGGGADLVILVKDPLRGDPRSQSLLLDKIETYLSFINSEEYVARFGTPTPETACVIIKCNRRPAPQIVSLIQQSERWAADNNACLRLEIGAS